MKNFFTISVLIMLFVNCDAQFVMHRWEHRIIDSTDPRGLGIMDFCIDSRGDSSLAFCGRFNLVNDTASDQFVRYTNGQIIRSSYSPPVPSFNLITYYKNYFYISDPGYIIKLDTNNWQFLSTHGGGRCFVYHDTLLINTNANLISGGAGNDYILYGYDGVQYFVYHGFDTIMPGTDKRLSDVIEYDGKLIVAGEFQKPGDTRKNIMQFDGEHWTSLDTGVFNRSTNNFVSSLASDGQYLYACGQIVNYDTVLNNYGGLTRWDGQKWEYLNYPFKSPVLWDMIFHEDTLLIVGAISTHNSNPHDSAGGIAMYYDGRWSINKTKFLAGPTRIERYKGKFYMCGYIYYMASDQIGIIYPTHDMVILESTHFDENIFLPVKSQMQSANLKVYPNPVTDLLFIDYIDASLKPTALKVYDMMGRLLIHTTTDLHQLDMSMLDRGIFVLQIDFEGVPQSTYSQVVQRQ